MEAWTRQIVIVVARADNGVIGRGGTLPWRIPADLRHFKTLTEGTPMIMGRRTFDSLPGLLPGRRHIVLTRDASWHTRGAESATSADEAFTLAGNAPVVSIIGGRQVFAMFMPLATRIELTEVYTAVDGDTIMPDPRGPGWTETARVHHAAVEDVPAYSFVTLVRRGDARTIGIAAPAP